MAILKNLTVNDTGFEQLPAGTTAQRPGTPTVGMVRFNTDTRVVEVYTSAGWVAYDDQQTATGGTISTAGGFTIHTFTSNGTFTPTYTGPVDVLIVAGGGAGAPGIGGGGGAGGLIYNQGVVVSGGTGYPVTIGPGGGAGPTNHGPDGPAGSPSSIFGITATGGGGGAGYYTPNNNSNTQGGSGGGGPGYGFGPGIRPGSTGTSGQGHPGGYGVHWPGTPAGTHYGGGGGGGAGEVGYNKYGNWPQAQAFDGNSSWDVTLAGISSGGNGMVNTMSGSATYYAGGGGGGNHGPGNNYGWAVNTGGLGGGGHGTGGNGNPATFYGGGGGGAHHPGNEQGGAGYQGIVIVRYKSS